MHCSGCGKDIPFTGEVCPHCQRDKRSDQSATVIGTIAVFLGGSIGYLVGGMPGAIVGALALGLIAGIGAAVAVAKPSHSTKKPPAVRLENSKTKPVLRSKTSDGDVAARLNKAKSLVDAGLISSEEYQKQREKILSSL